MARVTQPTSKQEIEWKAWVESRPEPVRSIAMRFDPWSLYLMKSTGHRVGIYSFSEDGTITVAVTGEFNAVAFDRRVFGISPEDLEECDLPGPDEIVGTAMTEQQVDENIDIIRATVRPDLFILDENGKAVRKN